MTKEHFEWNLISNAGKLVDLFKRMVNLLLVLLHIDLL